VESVCVVVLLLAATTIEIGCGNVYRPVAQPLPTTTGNPSGPETEVVLSCCLSPPAQRHRSTYSSVLTAVDVSATATRQQSAGQLGGNVVATWLRL